MSTFAIDIDVEKPELWSAEKPNLYALVLTLKDGEGEVVEILSKNFLDFPNWNLKGQEWDSFKDTIQTFTSAAKVWTDYRNQGSGDFTPSAIDINITRAKNSLPNTAQRK